MEFIDIYDDLGQKVDMKIEKDEAHKKAILHKGACVWIINSNNEILLQKRSSQAGFPNMLDISFSGHIQAGETSVEAVIREGQEELGINLELDKLQYLFSCREYGGIDGYYENEIDDVFLYRADIPIEEYNFCDKEVEKVVYVPFEEFKGMIEANDFRLLPYDTHYIFLLTALKSSLIKKGDKVERN